MIPKNNPKMEAAYAKKFKKKVEGITFITIRNGITTPTVTSRKPTSKI
jgi:hypothetical protein